MLLYDKTAASRAFVPSQGDSAAWALVNAISFEMKVIDTGSSTCGPWIRLWSFAARGNCSGWLNQPDQGQGDTYDLYQNVDAKKIEPCGLHEADIHFFIRAVLE